MSYNGSIMEDDIKQPEPAEIPSVAPVARKPASLSRPGTRLKASVVAGEYDMSRLLKKMRHASGLSVRAVAERMGIQRESLNQYYWQKRGRKGSSRLEWFLRYAEATGCTIWLTFPSQDDQIKLQAEHPTRPVGNPNWVKKKGPDEKA